MKRTIANTDKTKLYDYLLTGHFSNGRVIRARVSGENETMAKMLFTELPDVKELYLSATLEQYSIIELGEHDDILDNGRFVVGVKETTAVVTDMKNMVSCVFTVKEFEKTHRIVSLNEENAKMTDPLEYADIINAFAEYLAIYKRELL